MTFTGKNIIEQLTDSLARIVVFLIEKEKLGEFEYGTSVRDWKEKEKIIEPLELDYIERDGYYTVALAYLVSLYNGNVDFSNEKNLWRWSNAMIDLAQVASLPYEQMANLVNSFRVDANGITSQLRNAVRLYAKTRFDSGSDLITLLPDYAVSVRTGMMEADFDRYCELFPPSEDPDFSEAAMPYYLMSLKDLEGVEKENRKCDVLNLLVGNTSKFIVPVCVWIGNQRVHSTFIEDCVLALLNGLDEDCLSAVRQIDRAISYYHINREFLTKIAESLISQNHATEFLSMEDSLREFSEDSKAFIEFVLSFILHPKGIFRHVGRSLWDRYDMVSSDFNPMEMPEDDQLIFAYFMLSDLGNPQTRLPKLLPLLESESLMVRTALVKSLFPYLDDYMGHVIQALDDLKIDNAEAKSLRRYFEHRSMMVLDRRELKELATCHLDYNVYQEAKRAERQRIKEIVRESEKSSKSAFMELLSNVVLARGGGWRTLEGKTRHLASITHSVPSPVLHHSMSPLEKDKWYNELMRDWDETQGNN